MTIYEVLEQISNKGFMFIEKDSFPDNVPLENEEEKHVYHLIKNICGLHIEISDKDIEFAPFIIWNGKRSFSIEDMRDDDFKLLETLNFNQLPTNIRARITDLLWVERKICNYAHIALDAYTELSELLFSDDWVESLDMAKRAICISAQLNEAEKHTKINQFLYNKIIRTSDGGDEFLIINLAEIIIREKYGDADSLIDILTEVIQKSEESVRKVEIAYDLISECFKWKKDYEGLRNINILKAKYYEEEASKLKEENFQQITMATNYLKKAVLIYRDNGDIKSAEKIQKQIVHIQEKIPQMMPNIPITYDVSNLNEYIEECLNELSFEEAIMRLVQFTMFRKKEDIKKEVFVELEKNQIINLFPKKVINSSGQTIFNLEPLDTKNPERNQQLLKAHIHQKLFEYENIDGGLYLQMILEIIRNTYDFCIDDLNFLVSSNPIIPQGRERIFKSAIYMALKGQEYEAIHILSPQIENLFRNLAKELGALTVTLENNGTSREKVLASVFDLPELVDAYDNDILFVFAGLLNEQAGANIRNNIAHGLMGEESARSGICRFFICAVIRLLSYTSSQCIDILAKSKKIRNLKPPVKEVLPILKQYKADN